jgi:orotate phosphoribosyltransferase
METKAFTVEMAKNPVITVKVIPGHFTTSNVHSNNYLDVSELMSNAAVAREGAR